MANLARWERYSPVGIGLEDMFKRLDAFADNSSINYPPYDIVKVDDTSQELHVALAGFRKEDIEVSVERGVLSLSAVTQHKKQEYVHKGIANRDARRNWQLSDEAVVGEPRFENGMLIIPVSLVVPEAMQRKVLPIS